MSSKFQYVMFYDGEEILAVSKEKYSKEEAIEIAKVELERLDSEKPYFICINDGFVRHRAGVNDDGEPCVGWWLEEYPYKTSCPCWVFTVTSKDAKLNDFKDAVDYIVID